MLGGTNFLGPHLVMAALARGHEVTLFNRGITNPHLFPGVEKLRGNRYPGRDEGLVALEGSRQWDAVLDTWQEAPRCVASSCALLNDRARFYGYISSIAVYRDYREAGMDEAAPLAPMPDRQTAMGDDLSYTLLKRVAEEFTRRSFAERAGVYRCTSIAGFDHSGNLENQLAYWQIRIAMGGDVAVPADGDTPIQFIDVSDIANFVLRSIETSLGGDYNLVGPGTLMTFAEYINTISRIAGGDHRLVPIPRALFESRGVESFTDLKGYIPADDPEPGFYRISNRKAVAAGLTFRPYERTLRDFYRSYDISTVRRDRLPGLSAETEQQLLTAVSQAT